MTTTSKNAKTQALEALIEAHAIELKLPTVRRRYRALAAEALREQQTPVAYLAALLEAEMAERAERREKRRLIDARFPQIKRLEDFRFADNPTVPQATIAALAEGSWITDRESVIFIGDSGTGKTMLATALAVCACQQGRRVRFTTLASLANLQRAVTRSEPDGSEVFVTRRSMMRVLCVLVPTAAYVLAIQYLGIYLSSAIFITLFMIASRSAVWRAGLVGCGTALALFMMFERWFLVPLPKGPLEAMLGF